MTKLRTDHWQLKKKALELWKLDLALRQQLTKIDREITNLPNAWAGDDELHFHARWQGVKEESGTLQQTARGLTACAEHLLYAARVYREAQIDSVHAARELVR